MSRELFEAISCRLSLSRLIIPYFDEMTKRASISFAPFRQALGDEDDKDVRLFVSLIFARNGFSADNKSD